MAYWHDGANWNLNSNWHYRTIYEGMRTDGQDKKYII